jgi:hypothetical protein
LTTHEAAESFVSIIESHAAKLPKSEREARLKAFDEALSNVSLKSGLESRQPSETQESPLLARKRV